MGKWKTPRGFRCHSNFFFIVGRSVVEPQLCAVTDIAEGLTEKNTKRQNFRATERSDDLEHPSSQGKSPVPGATSCPWEIGWNAQAIAAKIRGGRGQGEFTIFVATSVTAEPNWVSVVSSAPVKVLRFREAPCQHPANYKVSPW